MKHILFSAIAVLFLGLTPFAAVAQTTGGTTSGTTGGTTSGGGSTNNTSYSRSSTLIFPKQTPLTLLQPPDETTPGSGTRTIPPQQGIDIIFFYFALLWPWLIGTAAGFAVLQGVVGGVQIMYSGSPEGVGAGKTRFQWALFGLLMVGLAGTILRIINPIFYV